MKIYEIIIEDISKDTSIKNIVDILKTELPALYSTLKILAEKYVRGHGELDRGFNFIAGSPKSKWMTTTGLRLRNSLYGLLRNLPRSPNLDRLKDYLSSSVGNSSFRELELNLLPILVSVAKSVKDERLFSAAQNAEKERDAFYDYCVSINDDSDEDNVLISPSVKSNIGTQNTEVERIINDTLNRIDSKVAGEIRNSISKSDNKLRALQQELSKRNINL